jgi:hypothetical protein
MTASAFLRGEIAAFPLFSAPGVPAAAQLAAQLATAPSKSCTEVRICPDLYSKVIDIWQNLAKADSEYLLKL